MSPIRTVMLAFVFVALGSCSSPTAPESPKSLPSDLPLEGAAAYFPVKAGNTWVYAQIDREGIPHPGERYVVTVDSVDGNVALLTGGSYSIAPDSVRVETMFEEERYATILRAPLLPGTTWQTYDASHRIVAVDTSITTPWRSFDDVIVVSSLSCSGWSGTMCFVSYETHSYYARGIGRIMSETRIAGALGAPIVVGDYLVAFNHE